MITCKYREAYDFFEKFYVTKGGSYKYVKLAEAYMENLATVVATLEMIQEDTNEDPVYQKIAEFD